MLFLALSIPNVHGAHRRRLPGLLFKCISEANMNLLRENLKAGVRIKFLFRHDGKKGCAYGTCEKTPSDSKVCVRLLSKFASSIGVRTMHIPLKDVQGPMTSSAEDRHLTSEERRPLRRAEHSPERKPHRAVTPKAKSSVNPYVARYHEAPDPRKPHVDPIPAPLRAFKRGQRIRVESPCRNPKTGKKITLSATCYGSANRGEIEVIFDCSTCISDDPRYEPIVKTMRSVWTYNKITPNPDLPSDYIFQVPLKYVVGRLTADEMDHNVKPPSHPEEQFRVGQCVSAKFGSKRYLGYVEADCQEPGKVKIRWYSNVHPNDIRSI